MATKTNIENQIGSYLDNMRMPKMNEKVWTLIGFENTIREGSITNITNIDNKGAANTYVDIKSNGSRYHINIDQIFDHIPKKVKKQDTYGTYTVWQ